MAKNQRKRERLERLVADQPPPDIRPPYTTNNQRLRMANALMAKNGYCYLRLFKRQYRYWASQEFGKFPNARTIMRNLDSRVTRSDNRITWEIRGRTLHVNKAMHNNPAELSTMILWAVQNPFEKIGGDAGPITHCHTCGRIDAVKSIMLSVSTDGAMATARQWPLQR